MTASVGKERNSQVLIANAWHHRTDAVSSVVSLLAIVASMCGATMLDPIAGLMVAGMVALTGVQVKEGKKQRLWEAFFLGGGEGVGVHQNPILKCYVKGMTFC